MLVTVAQDKIWDAYMELLSYIVGLNVSALLTINQSINQSINHSS